MELARTLADALERLLAAGRVEVRENGARLAVFEGFQYEVREQREVVLLHLWSKERNVVRRVASVTADEAGRLALETMRFGRKRPDRLEFVAEDAPRPPGRIVREDFQSRFRELLAHQFPDETLASLTSTPDLKHSLSGNYARGSLQTGSRRWAVLGSAPGESAATYDAMLTFGLLWLDRARESLQRGTLAGLRLFFPVGVGGITARRLQALSSSAAVELYEYNVESWRARLLDAQDVGNIDTWLVSRRETDAVLHEAEPIVERIRNLIPGATVASGAIQAAAIPSTREFGAREFGTHQVALRFRGLIFARWSREGMFYGAGDPKQLLTPDHQADFARLVRDLNKHRSPVGASARHPLYRAQAERWLETLVAADPGRIDARLDPRFLYAQVPAFSAGERTVMDLIGVTRAGRLAVLELKASEDPHLVMQAVDYWLRVRWHHARQDFSRYGYFPGITLDSRPPLLFLVAPAIRFHSANDILLRYLSDEIEICRVGVSENWRRGLKVVLRQ